MKTKLLKHVTVELWHGRSRALLEQRTQELTAARTKCQVPLVAVVLIVCSVWTVVHCWFKLVYMQMLSQH